MRPLPGTSIYSFWDDDPEMLLRIYGLRATKVRVAVTVFLLKEPKPLSVEAIKQSLSDDFDTASVYRVLDSLVSAGLAKRMDLGHGHAHYEMVAGRPHHHHAVCSDCGLIEDIEVPHAKSPQVDALKATKAFSTITDYSLEFFGQCKSCA